MSEILMSENCLEHPEQDLNVAPGAVAGDFRRNAPLGPRLAIVLAMIAVLVAGTGVGTPFGTAKGDRLPTGDDGVQSSSSPADTSCSVIASHLQRRAADTLAASQNLLQIAPAVAERHVVHAVVEIPAGTADKWEVTKDGRSLVIERSGGALRRIDYLPYPANYGFMPRTRSDSTAGGDGDALDVILLGPSAPCGAVVRARVLGVLRLIDDGETDHKVLAVRPNAPLGDVDSMDDLRDRYPGVLDILQTWFVNYEGPGNYAEGFSGVEAAWSVVSEAARAFADAGSSPPER